MCQKTCGENNITVDDKVQDLIKKQQESCKLSQSDMRSVVKTIFIGQWMS